MYCTKDVLNEFAFVAAHEQFHFHTSSCFATAHAYQHQTEKEHQIAKQNQNRSQESFVLFVVENWIRDLGG